MHRRITRNRFRFHRRRTKRSIGIGRTTTTMAGNTIPSAISNRSATIATANGRFYARSINRLVGSRLTSTPSFDAPHSEALEHEYHLRVIEWPLPLLQIEQPAITKSPVFVNDAAVRKSSLRRDTVKDMSHNGNADNVSSGKSITSIASPAAQKPSRMANGNMSGSGSMNSVIFPLLSDVSANHIYQHQQTHTTAPNNNNNNNKIRFVRIDPKEVSLLGQKCVRR